MFNKNESKNTMTKVQLTITLILILFLTVTGATYAYFAVSATSTNMVTGTAATVNLTLNVVKVFPASSSTNTGVMVPQKSVSGSNTSPLSTALKNGCVDGNSNVVCQVYKIDIKNDGGTATQVVDGEILFYSNSTMTTDVSSAMPNLMWKRITSVNATTPSSSVLGTNADMVADATGDNVFANDITMVTNANFTYYIIIWINENDDDQPTDKGKTFYGKVSFNSANGTGVTSTFTS